MSVLSLALPVLLLWRCAARPEPPPRAAVDSPSGSEASTVLNPSPPLPSVPPSRSSEPASSGSAEAPAPTPVAPLTSAAPSSSSGSAAPIIAAVGQRDPRDLALLSRIERELKRDPPPSVHGLIRLRETGASRSQLLAELDKQIPQDLALRVLVRRWIDDVAPDGARSPKPLGPAPSGTADPLIKPLERTKGP